MGEAAPAPPPSAKEGAPAGQKSLVVAWLLWLFFPVYPWYHFYLKRDAHAVLYATSLNGCMMGWFLDALCMPWYVKAANGTDDPAVTRARVTSWQSLGGLLGPARLLLSFVSAAVWGNVAAAAVPAFADVVQPLGRDLVCAARVLACVVASSYAAAAANEAFFLCRARSSFKAARSASLIMAFFLCLSRKSRDLVAQDDNFVGLVVSVAMASVMGARASRQFVDPAPPAAAPPAKAAPTKAKGKKEAPPPAAAKPPPPPAAPPRSTFARLVRHLVVVALFYALALSGSSASVKRVRRPATLFYRCNFKKDDAACAKRLRFVAKVSKQNQLFKARRILNLKKDATLDDAKRARKKIALEHHPDKNPSKKSHEIFGYSEAAYEVLAADFKEKKRAAEAAEKAAATPRS